MYKLRHYLDKKALMMVFNSLILSHINYGSLSWGRADQSTPQPVTRLLNKTMKCINVFSYQHVQISALYNSCNVLQLRDIFK